MDREAACEFLFYCLTLLKKKKIKRIKCFDLSGTSLWQLLCATAVGRPERSPPCGAGADVVVGSAPARTALGTRGLVAGRCCPLLLILFGLSAARA